MSTEPKPFPPMPYPKEMDFYSGNPKVASVIEWGSDLASRLTASQALVEELAGEMRRYLPILECAESDPQTWIALSEGTGMATVNGYRAALSHYKEATR